MLTMLTILILEQCSQFRCKNDLVVCATKWRSVRGSRIIPGLCSFFNISSHSFKAQLLTSYIIVYHCLISSLTCSKENVPLLIWSFLGQRKAEFLSMFSEKNVSRFLLQRKRDTIFMISPQSLVAQILCCQKCLTGALLSVMLTF